MESIRPPAVAGMFYPGQPAALRAYLGAALEVLPTYHGPFPKAIIAPHAGYVYSGSIAATIYRQVQAFRQQIRRVVLLGPTHRVAVQGIALPTVSAFRTPLGDVPLDQDGLRTLLNQPGIVSSDLPHGPEHSLEVQLPFLQYGLDDFSLLPLAVGQASPQLVAQTLETLWGDDETLIVISSDLSHYLPYDQARQMDQQTCARILTAQEAIRPQEACGAYPINGLILAARRHGLQGKLLDLRNSGDTAGDKNRVVGYAAFAYTQAGAPHEH